MFKLTCLMVLLAVLPYAVQGQAQGHIPSKTDPFQTSVSYIKYIRMEKRHDTWRCGSMDCARDAVGCQVTIKSDCAYDCLTLAVTYYCLDKNKEPMKDVYESQQMDTPRKIDIQLATYDNVPSNYVRWYGIGGETAKGQVAPNKWPQIKREAEEDRKQTEEIFNELAEAMKEYHKRNPKASHKINLSDNDYKKMVRYVLYGF